MPIGGNSAASDVPWARSCENPKRARSIGTEEDRPADPEHAAHGADHEPREDEPDV